jgi:hypothetical protein
MGSKNLTTAVQSYAVTGDEQYYQNYMKELNEDKNRDIAWAGLQDNDIEASEWAMLEEIAAMSDEDAQSIYDIHNRIAAFVKNEVKNYAKGYSRQRMIEQLNELVDILDARVSMKLIEDGEWNPEEEKNRPALENNYTDKPGDDNTGDDNNDEDNNGGDVVEPAPQNFFVRLIQMIIAFFKRLFGIQ